MDQRVLEAGRVTNVRDEIRQNQTHDAEEHAVHDGVAAQDAKHQQADAKQQRKHPLEGEDF